MKKFRKYLPAIALAFAALGAFAFNEKEDDSQRMLFGKLVDQQGNTQWVQATPGYNCERLADICVAEFDNNDPATGQIVYQEEGRFIP